jgi:hypothetical protein
MSARKLLEDIAESATRARAHYQVWWALSNRIYPDLIDRANEYADFFMACDLANYSSMFIHLGHLFDRRRDSASIHAALEALRGELPDGDLAAYSAASRELAVRAEPFIAARHKTVAHIDAKLTEQEVFQVLPEVKWNDLRDLIDDTCSLVRNIVRRAGSPAAVFDSQRYLEATIEVVRRLPTKRS